MSLYEQRLANDLATVREKVAEVGSLVDEALQNGIQAVMTGDRDIANDVILGDHHINRTFAEVDTTLPPDSSTRHNGYCSYIMGDNIILPNRQGLAVGTLDRQAPGLSAFGIWIGPTDGLRRAAPEGLRCAPPEGLRCAPPEGLRCAPPVSARPPRSFTAQML